MLSAAVGVWKTTTLKYEYTLRAASLLHGRGQFIWFSSTVGNHSCLRDVPAAWPRQAGALVNRKSLRSAKYNRRSWLMQLRWEPLPCGLLCARLIKLRNFHWIWLMDFFHPLVILQVYSGRIFYSDILYMTATLLTYRLFENTVSNKVKGGGGGI